MSAFLEFDQVSHAYGQQTVVDTMSFTLVEGEIGCLLGSSGCGKTTVLRCLAGFEPIRAGSIRLAGQTLSLPGHQVPAHARQIGMVFQDYALFPHLTVGDNVAFGLRRWSRAERLRRVASLLDLVGLAGLARSYPHELSGGQQQRVALARALAPRPRLLLLDEPFSNLDVDLRSRLSAEVRAILKQENTTAILVTHDQHEAFAMADRVGVMQAGRLLQWAAPYTLYHQPASRFVADFIGQGVFLPGVVTGPACIETEIGEFCGAVPVPFDVGQRVEVLLRPDDVQHDDASSRKAVVESKVFRGSEFHYTLALPSGRRVLAEVPSHHDHPVGEPIGIRLEMDHLIAFPAH
ncbi:ABC-type Fe3+/spermidine/putrescine transport systems, ATPase components [Gulbenkiania indica]|uniref:ABC-type Fe3+/spermidine/putrescine transport systems, ATPase components n=1 Tax=Gulbenkiania indica TaxID=375574 RepID=A0A0K6GUJ9_9NEIS|nr:ABC transporter ATP-binding protein [Gulbenkiania indica]CUA82263.1 ABC-type Fe3+/spermidine/putrescine transport systems, ATPase components [Gulbenkiania indica]